ncbi:LOW QUALITY PROTEIN: hypothetical protein U9M48_020558 [Paspalum notatum var. saurae]|uniref:Reverse transcriptase zinc-binding domain-containing protein n=1 Tax=Paspalum notatum var. saurae TaxID=547442 RepID=A0AAQ3THP8_PASNO
MPVFQDTEDYPVWHPDPKGLFSVKSAYALGIRIQDYMNGADTLSSSTVSLGFDWKRIWRMDIPNKVKIFMWQLVRNSLQVKRNIARRGVKLETLCPMCQRFDEDSGHLFFKCKGVRRCWLLLNLEEARMELISLNSGLDMIEKIWSFPENYFLVMWTTRNKVNVGKRSKSAEEVISNVVYHVNAWNLANGQLTQPERILTRQKWEKPPENYYKINCDGAFLPDLMKGGWGFVIRDHTGQVATAGAGAVNHLLDAQHAEVWTCLKGLEQASFLGMQRVIV